MHATRSTQAAPLAALFVSDIHLSPALPLTTAAFLRFLAQHGAGAKRLYLLGDLFEYWVGDDDLDDPYHQTIVCALQQLAAHGTELFWIGGNRDFLIGSAFALATSMQLLPEPSVIVAGAQRIIICHGDAACTDDLDYMRFRSMVRSSAWQAQFLAQDLATRKQLVAGMRNNSKAEQAQKEMAIMDVNPAAITAVFDACACDTMIHGHTHRPALHEQDGRRRYVLADWDCDNAPARGGWIAIDETGTISRHHLDGSVISA